MLFTTVHYSARAKSILQGFNTQLHVADQQGEYQAQSNKTNKYPGKPSVTRRRKVPELICSWQDIFIVHVRRGSRHHGMCLWHWEWRGCSVIASRTHWKTSFCRQWWRLEAYWSGCGWDSLETGVHGRIGWKRLTLETRRGRRRGHVCNRSWRIIVVMTSRSGRGYRIDWSRWNTSMGDSRSGWGKFGHGRRSRWDNLCDSNRWGLVMGDHWTGFHNHFGGERGEWDCRNGWGLSVWVVASGYGRKWRNYLRNNSQ